MGNPLAQTYPHSCPVLPNCGTQRGHGHPQGAVPLLLKPPCASASRLRTREDLGCGAAGNLMSQAPVFQSSRQAWPIGLSHRPDATPLTGRAEVRQASSRAGQSYSETTSWAAQRKSVSGNISDQLGLFPGPKPWKVGPRRKMPGWTGPRVQQLHSPQVQCEDGAAAGSPLAHDHLGPVTKQPTHFLF